MRAGVAVCVVVLGCLWPSVGASQDAGSVLVVANEAAPDSGRLAEHYALARNIPPTQIVRVTTSTTEDIDHATFDQTIQRPLAEWLTSSGAQDRIVYIVLTRGVPLRIRGTGGRQGTVASVDSELTLLYRRLTGAPVPLTGPVENPYFLGERAEPSRVFDRAEQDIYLVTRLDGFTTGDAIALIDRGTSRPAGDGVILLDAPSDVTDPRNQWLARSSERLKDVGAAVTVVHEPTSRVLAGYDNVIGYFSWGSNDPAMRLRAPDVRFAPGAIAGMFLSSDARTLVEPPADWTPASQQRSVAGSRQALIGDLVRAGVTGVSGAVAEPFLDGAVRPDLLFPAYAAGATLGEAYYLAMPHLSWQMIVLGDPLCAPFASGPPGVRVTPPHDPETDLPAHFSTRRLAALARTLKAPERAVKLLMRAEARRARGDAAGAIEALEQAVIVDATFVAAWRQLATEFDIAERHAEAQDAYRRVLKLDRNDIVALNNLAYGLAVHAKQLDEAIELASRAATLARGNPLIDDTLGWIHFLRGDHNEALRLIGAAARALPRNADVQFHAAVVYASLGKLDEARTALDTALKLDPEVRGQPEFADVQRRLGRDPQSR